MDESHEIQQYPVHASTGEEQMIYLLPLARWFKSYQDIIVPIDLIRWSLKALFFVFFILW